MHTQTHTHTHAHTHTHIHTHIHTHTHTHTHSHTHTHIHTHTHKHTNTHTQHTHTDTHTHLRSVRFQPEDLSNLNTSASRFAQMHDKFQKIWNETKFQQVGLPPYAHIRDGSQKCVLDYSISPLPSARRETIWRRCSTSDTCNGVGRY